MTYEPLRPDGYATIIGAFEPGAVPMLTWINVADLVTDPTYQREIRNRGNVRRIAREFRWSRFMPIVVAPVEGGKFAVIDGQHRSTAAALHGVKTVPAMVVSGADRAEQAAAFRAINGTVTAVTRQNLHYAGLAAGDAEALAVGRVCTAADVTIQRGNTNTIDQKPGATMSVGTITKCVSRFGEPLTITALQCITRTAEGNAGCLTNAMIVSICEVLAENSEWCEAGGRLLDALDDFPFEEELDRAGHDRPKGTTQREALKLSLMRHLTQKMGGGKPSMALPTPSGMAGE